MNTGAGKPFKLELQSGEADLAAGDDIASIIWRAPNEGTGTDAISTAAEIVATAETDFSASVNKTSLKFRTGISGNANDKLTITSDGRGLSQFTAACWCCFDGQNTISIRDSHNVASISDNGTADYTVNIDVNMQNRNYAVVGSAGRDGSTGFTYNYGVTFSSKNAGDIRLRVRTSESSGVDVDENMIVIFGDT